MKRAESGQILPIVALLMLVILGMAAFAVDGSNVYSQHRRWQADLDVGVTDAAAQLNSGTTYTTTLQQAMSRLTQTLAQDGYPVSGSTITTTISGNNLNYGGCLTKSGITLCNPPVSTPFKGLSHYVQGTISYDVAGFFGRVIGLGKMHINVQAVAKHTGSVTESPYAILALNTMSNNTNHCPINGNGASGSIYVDGSIRSNDVNCATTNFPYTVTGSSEMSGSAAEVTQPVMTGTLGTSTGVNPTTDPYPAPPSNLATSSTPSTCSTSNRAWATNCSGSSVPSTSLCYPEVNYYLGPNAATALASTNSYFVFGLPGTAVHVDWNTSSNQGGNYYLLPGCDGSPTGTVPGVFYFTGTLNDGGNHPISVESFSSTVVLPNALDAHFTLSLNSASSAFMLQAPGPGSSPNASNPYAGIALTQLRTPDPTSISGLNCGSTSSSLSSLSMQGNGNFHAIGIVDAPCTSIKWAGSSGNTGTSCPNPNILGAVVANDWGDGGGSNVCVRYDAQGHGFLGGGVLVY